MCVFLGLTDDISEASVEYGCRRYNGKWQGDTKACQKKNVIP